MVDDSAMTDPQGAWSVGTRRHPGEGHGRRLEWPDTVRCGRGAGGGKSGNGCRAWARPIRMRDVCLARREWRGRVGAGVCVAVSCATSAPRPLRWCPVVSGETIPCFARIAALLLIIFGRGIAILRIGGVETRRVLGTGAGPGFETTPHTVRFPAESSQSVS